MLITLSADSVYELMMKGNASTLIDQAISRAGEDGLSIAPGVQRDVFLLLVAEYRAGHLSLETLLERSALLGAIPANEPKFDNLAETVSDLHSTGLEFVERLYVATARFFQSRILTTDETLADKLKPYASVTCIKQ